jgi:hypothetical protein
MITDDVMNILFGWDNWKKGIKGLLPTCCLTLGGEGNNFKASYKI